MEMTGPEVLHVPAGEGKSLQIMGNRVDIKAASENTEDAFAVLEYRLAPQTPGPPLHLHRRTDEAFYVLEGELTFHLEDRSVKAGQGAFVLVPRGVIHTFENAAGSEARFLELVAPGSFAGYFEELLAALPAGDGDGSLREVRYCPGSAGRPRIDELRERTRRSDFGSFAGVGINQNQGTRHHEDARSFGQGTTPQT